MSYKVRTLVKLKEHNSFDQLNYGGHRFADTKEALEVGQYYDVDVRVGSWHTEYHIDGKFYNSVCFETVTAKHVEIIPDLIKACKGLITGINNPNPDATDEIAEAEEFAITTIDIAEARC